jgi:superfamily II DNA or RNA helicase
MLSRNERQSLGVEKWVNNKCRGTWAWCTGVGKTIGAMKAIKLFLTKNKNKKIVVIVPTEALKIQWIQVLSKNNLYFDVSVEIINSAIKIQSKVDFIILDECHRYASELFFQIFKQRNPTIVLGLSATFERLDGKHELLAKFCPVCDTISVKDAIENKWLSPYKEYKVLLKVDDLSDYMEYNKEFYNSFSFFHNDFNLAMKCLTNIIYRRQYAKSMKITPSEIDAIVFTWHRALKNRKKFVMEHPKKIEITQRILNARRGSKAITFSATIKQAEKIGAGYIVHSGKTKKKNRMTIDEFSKLKTGVIHSSKALNEGVDCPGLNLAIILSNTSSSTDKVQRIGRVIRFEEGKEAEVFTLIIEGTNEEHWFNTSSAGQSVIEIDEHELDLVLNYIPFQENEISVEGSQLLFRL